MIEVIGNLWTYPADYRIITTNGSLKRDGCAVMGRGCAFQATKRYKFLQRDLGKLLSDSGNKLYVFMNLQLITFPVKYKWYEKANLDLIQKSTKELLSQIHGRGNLIYVMPRPGCGNGQLDWVDVKPILEILPDNVKVISLRKDNELA